MKKFSILVIENDPDEQVFIKEAFDETPYFDLLGLLTSGQELLPYLQAETLPDLILSELLMPVMDGFDVISTVKSDQQFEKLPVYIMSTTALEAIIEKCLHLGAAAYIEKPNLLLGYSGFLERLYTIAEDNISRQ
jgi:CheY-like chemotaxis protein